MAVALLWEVELEYKRRNGEEESVCALVRAPTLQQAVNKAIRRFRNAGETRIRIISALPTNITYVINE